MVSSLEKRSGPRGDRYLVRWREVENGKIKARSKSFLDEKPARDWKDLLDKHGVELAEQVLSSGDAGKAAKQELTVAAWTERHIAALTGISEGTRSDYRMYLRRDIAPRIGNLPLPSLTREVIGAWVNELADSSPGGRGLSGKSVANRHSLLSASLTSAVRAGHIPTNHAKGIRLPRADHNRTEMVVLSVPEQNDLLSCIQPRYRAVIATLLLTGLRWGEVSALTVGHLSLEQSTLRVRQSWKHNDGRTPILGPPKSRRGTRDLSITPDAVEVLRRQIVGKQAEDWVFAAPRGGPLRHNTFWDEVWSPAVSVFAGDYCDVATKKRVPGRGKRPRIHDLRHTYASTMIAESVPLPYLQHHLGHESIQTTSDVYGHLQKRAHYEMIAAASAGFAGLDIGSTAPAIGPVLRVLED